MEKDWVLLISSTDQIRIEIIHKMLLGNDVDAVKINQKDSSYPMSGEVKIYVNKKDRLRGIHLINSLNHE